MNDVRLLDIDNVHKRRPDISLSQFEILIKWAGKIQIQTGRRL